MNMTNNQKLVIAFRKVRNAELKILCTGARENSLGGKHFLTAFYVWFFENNVSPERIRHETNLNQTAVLAAETLLYLRPDTFFFAFSST